MGRIERCIWGVGLMWGGVRSSFNQPSLRGMTDLLLSTPEPPNPCQLTQLANPSNLPPCFFSYVLSTSSSTPPSQSPLEQAIFQPTGTARGIIYSEL